jgi:hypothetical protein
VITPTAWIEAAIRRAETCPGCAHQDFADGCDCLDGDCICFQARKPGKIWCLTCAFAPELTEPGIYDVFGAPPLQYAEQWYDHVNELHRQHDGAHEANWTLDT